MPGEGFWMISEALLAYVILIGIASYTHEPLAWDAVKVIGGGFIAWGGQWMDSRGKTSIKTE